MIAYAAVLSVVVLVIILQGTQALCYNMVNSEDAKKESNKSDHALTMKREQLDSLNGFKKVLVVDESAEQPKKDTPAPKPGEIPAGMKEVTQIPIELAQQKILEELGRTPSPQPGT